MGIFFAFLSMLGFGLSNALAKQPSREFGSVPALFLRQCVVVLMVLTVMALAPVPAEISGNGLLIALALAMIGYLPVAAFFEGMRRGKIGVVAGIGNSKLLVTVMLSSIFLGEQITLQQGLLVMIIISGLLALSLDFRDLPRSDLFTAASGVPHAVVACLLWGVIFFLLKIPVQMIGPVLTTVVIEAGVLICGGLHVRLRNMELRRPRGSMVLMTALCGICCGCGTLFYNLAIARADVTLVSAISFSAPVVSALYGRIVHDERLSRAQMAALAVIITGVTILSLSYRRY